MPDTARPPCPQDGELQRPISIGALGDAFARARASVVFVEVLEHVVGAGAALAAPRLSKRPARREPRPPNCGHARLPARGSGQRKRTPFYFAAALL
jgi:hypothetical protein